MNNFDREAIKMKLIDPINFFVSLFLGLIGVFITGTFIGAAAG